MLVFSHVNNRVQHCQCPLGGTVHICCNSEQVDTRLLQVRHHELLSNILSTSDFYTPAQWCHTTSCSAAERLNKWNNDRAFHQTLSTSSSSVGLEPCFYLSPHFLSSLSLSLCEQEVRGKDTSMAKVAPSVPTPISTLALPTIVLQDMEAESGEASEGDRWVVKETILMCQTLRCE